jgi:hypothetical protein
MKCRDNACQITIRSDTAAEERRLIGAILKLIAEDSSVNLDEFALTVFQACGRESSS